MAKAMRSLGPASIKRVMERDVKQASMQAQNERVHMAT
jgi:hypothetical protein